MSNKTLRLALNTVDTQRAEMIGQVVAAEGWQVLPFVGQPIRIDWLQQLQVDLIIVDLDMPDALVHLSELSRKLVGVPLLALATAQHLVRLQEAFLAGASDFVAFPIDATHFIATVHRVLQRRTQVAAPQSHKLQKSQVVAVTGLRGGIGRSTIAVNLAIALQQRTKTDTILAEAHHGLSHLSLMLNMHPRYTLANVAEEPNIDRDIMHAYLQAHNSGIRLLSAPTELDHLVELSIETWRHTLNMLTEIAPQIVIDTAAVADELLSDVLLHADDIVVVTSADIPGLRGTLGLLATLRNEQEFQGRIHVVLNRAGVRGGLDASVIQKQLREKALLTIPEDTPLATYALNRGVPYVLSHPRAVISRRIYALADQLLSGAPVKDEKSKVTNVFRALLPMNGNGKGG